MPTLDLLAAPPNFLPAALLQANLLDFVLVHVTLALLASVVLRLRLYWSVYRIAKYFAASCPNVFELLNRHLAALVQNGIVPMLMAYGAVFGAYFAMSRFAFPGATLSLAELSQWPGALALCLALYGAMAAIDLAMTLQVAQVDVGWVEAQLRYAEEWLGGRLNRALDVLGRWNPIRQYADVQTRLALGEFNALFRYSLALTIFQTAVRMALVAALFVMLAKLHRLNLPLTG